MSSLVGGVGIIVQSAKDTCYSSGIMRWDAATQNAQVMFGDTWTPIASGYGSISLDPMYQKAIEWAMQKQKEEVDLALLCAKHPGLQDVKEKYEMMLALVRQELKDGTI